MTYKQILPLFLIAGSVFAQSSTCSGAADFSGYYVFASSRMLFSKPLPPAPNVTNARPRFSSTPVGALLKGALDTAPFAVTGRLVADGQGSLFASAPDAVFVTTRVGTYSVTTECTLTLTITDGFLTPDLLEPFTTGTVRFTGLLGARGGESTLIQTSGGKGVTLSIGLAAVAHNCSNATMSGGFALAANGVEWTAEEEAKPQTLAIYSMVGRIVSDGNGKLFIEDTTAGKLLQISGSYSIQPDCTGMARLIEGKTTRNISFVLLQSSPASFYGAVGASYSRPVIRFAITDPKVAAVGQGREATGRL